MKVKVKLPSYEVVGNHVTYLGEVEKTVNKPDFTPAKPQDTVIWFVMITLMTILIVGFMYVDTLKSLVSMINGG